MCKGITVYDPRVQDREFILANSKVWSSARSNVVFFESDDYSIYTSPEFLRRVLTCLIAHCSVTKVGVRTNEAVLASSFEDAEGPYALGNAVSGIFDLARLECLIELFEKEGDHGIWDFYGLPAEFQDVHRLTSFPEVLKDIDLFVFVIEVDLDGMLMGYARPASYSALDNLIQRLEALSICDTNPTRQKYF